MPLWIYLRLNTGCRHDQHLRFNPLERWTIAVEIHDMLAKKNSACPYLHVFYDNEWRIMPAATWLIMFSAFLMIPVQAPIRAASLVIVSKVKCAFIKMIWTTSCPCITVEKFGWWSDFSRWLTCVWTDRGSFAANQTVLIGALLQQQEREALSLWVLILLSSKLFLPYNSFGCRWM